MLGSRSRLAPTTRLLPLPLQTSEFGREELSLRAKGTLISEPRSLPPARCDFSHARKEHDLFRGFFSEKAIFPFSRGKNGISQGVENRGSLISVPLVLRVGIKVHSYKLSAFSSLNVPSTGNTRGTVVQRHGGSTTTSTPIAFPGPNVPQGPKPRKI